MFEKISNFEASFNLLVLIYLGKYEKRENYLNIKDRDHF